MLKTNQNNISKKHIKWGSILLNTHYFSNLIQDIRLYLVISNFTKSLSLDLVNILARRSYNNFLVLLFINYKKTRARKTQKTIILRSHKVLSNNLLNTFSIYKYSYYVNFYILANLLLKYVNIFIGSRLNLIVINQFTCYKPWKRRLNQWMQLKRIMGIQIYKPFISSLYLNVLKERLLKVTNWRRTIKWFHFTLVKWFPLGNGVSFLFKGKLRKLKSNAFNYKFGPASKSSDMHIYNYSDISFVNNLGVSRIRCSVNLKINNKLLISKYNYRCI